MIALVISVSYALAGLVTARLVAGHLAWTFFESGASYRSPHSPNGDQWLGGWCLGLLAGAIWPVILMFVLLPTRRGRWVVGAEARAVRKARDEQIARLERELEIR